MAPYAIYTLLTSKMVEYLELSVAELLLDEDNPRLGSVASQSEALEEIIRLSDSHFRNMMLSIKENGLDPGDSLYIVAAETGEDFIVLEGNRRLSAMMVLNNPDLLSNTDISDTTKKSLLRASKGFNIGDVEPIRCVLFLTREKTPMIGFFADIRERLTAKDVLRGGH